MTLSVFFEPSAVEDLHGARDWYEGAVRGLGEDLVDEVWTVINRAVKWPAAAPSSEEAVPGGGTRQVHRAPVRRFPYRVVYVVIGDVLWVAAVAHTRRRPGYWRQRLPR